MKQPLHSAIAIYTPTYFSGYGDILFAIKLAAIIKQTLLELNYTGNVLFIRRDEKFDHIITALLHPQQFSILTRQEYYALLRQPNFKLDYYIHGPVPQDFLVTPLTTRSLLLSEYGDGEYLNSDEYLKLKYKKLSNRRITTFPTGFPIYASEAKGIFFSVDLAEFANLQKTDNAAFITTRALAWNGLPTQLHKLLLNTNAPEAYHEKSNLSFEYSHYSHNEYLAYQSNFHLHFLACHLSYYRNSSQNQDIISIGDEFAYKQTALTSISPELIGAGFTNIELINVDTAETTLIHRSNTQGKHYKLFHITKLDHQQILNLYKISGDLVGVTGDQSFSEAMSAQKLIVYECATWKKDFIHSYINIFYKHTNDLAAKELLTLLLTATTQEQYQRLEYLIQQEKITDKIKNSAAILTLKYSLNKHLQAFIKREISLMKIRKLEDLMHAIRHSFTKRLRFYFQQIRFIFKAARKSR